MAISVGRIKEDKHIVNSRREKKNQKNQSFFLGVLTKLRG